MDVDDSRKHLVSCNQADAFPEQIRILRNQRAPYLGGTLQNDIVVVLGTSVFLDGYHVNPAQSECLRDCTRNMLIHVESKTHTERLSRFSLRLKTGSDAC